MTLWWIGDVALLVAVLVVVYLLHGVLLTAPQHRAVAWTASTVTAAAGRRIWMRRRCSDDARSQVSRRSRESPTTAARST